MKVLAYGHHYEKAPSVQSRLRDAREAPSVQHPSANSRDAGIKGTALPQSARCAGRQRRSATLATCSGMTMDEQRSRSGGTGIPTKTSRKIIGRRMIGTHPAF